MVTFLSENWHLSESQIITDNTDDADFKRFCYKEIALRGKFPESINQLTLHCPVDFHSSVKPLSDRASGPLQI